MRALLVTLSLFIFFSCESTQKKETGETPADRIFLALYYRYVADSGDGLAEVVSVKGTDLRHAESYDLPQGVFFNGGLMERVRSGMGLPAKYVTKTKDEFPVKVRLSIENLLDYEAVTPLLKGLEVKKEGDSLTINAKTAIGEDETLILVFSNRDGSGVTRKITGPASFPQKISAAGIEAGMTLSPSLQRRAQVEKDSVRLNATLEYYAADREVD